MFYEIWVKGYSIPKMSIYYLIRKHTNLWTNGRVLRTNKLSVAKQVKKDLERSCGSNVYIAERE